MKNLFIFLFALVFSGLTAQNKMPNILVFSFDDLRPEIGAYGAEQVLTPTIDALAAEGTRFNNAYITYPLCLPSRSAMLTGIRFNNRIFGESEEDKALPNKKRKQLNYKRMLQTQTTWPEVLKNEGYWTATRGKLYHGNVPRFHRELWDIPGSLYNDPGPYKVAEDLLKKVVDKGGVKKDVAKMMQGKSGPGAVAYLSIDCEDNVLHEGAVADDVVDYLLNKRDKNKPFAIAAGFSRPHLPWIAPQKYFDMYPEDAGYLAPVPKGVKKVIQKKDQRPISSNLWNEGLSDKEAKKLVRAYMATTTYADAQMGRIVDALKKTGEYENTIIILWGDHGYHLSEHGLWQKNKDYRVSMRFPLIIKAPGFKGGQASDRVVQNIDIYPTMLSLAGIKVPKKVTFDGHDLKPLLKNPNDTSWEHVAFTSCIGKRRGIITEQYRFTDFGWNNYELYDIKKDSGEWNDLAKDPKYKKILNAFKKQVETVGWNNQ